jgi:hypothetical protein
MGIDCGARLRDNPHLLYEPTRSVEHRQSALIIRGARREEAHIIHLKALDPLLQIHDAVDECLVVRLNQFRGFSYRPEAAPDVAL